MNDPRLAEKESPSTAAPTSVAATPDVTPHLAGSTASSIPVPSGYEILYDIGEGGMGVVFRARDLALDRPVALKYLREGYAANPSAAARFLHEARVTARLQHPGIPPVHQVGTLADGRPFLAMKLIEGQTLHDLLKEQGPGSGRWLGVFESICQAVGYAHSQGVIHRDLKPGNVMVGAFAEVQVMDWGLAKVLGRSAGAGPAPAADPEATTPLADDPEATTPPDTDPVYTPGTEETSAGSVLGTPAFMPPEQAIGAVDRVDRRSDVFGLGAILCALLTGKPPFVGRDAESTRQLAARAKLGDAFSRLEGCGAEPELIALARRCLSAEADERPADAGELADAVTQLRRQSEERARQAELETARALVQASEQRKRRRLTLVASGVLVAVLLGGIGGIAFGLLEAEGQRKAAVKAKGEADDNARDARTEQGKAEDARQTAEQRRIEADNQRKAADRARREANDRSVRLALDNSQRFALDGDLSLALLSAVTAWRTDAPDGARGKTHPVRVATLFQQAPRPLRLFRTGKAVTHVEFSPDGRLLLIAGQNGTARVYDARTGASAGPELAHEAPVNHAAFSPDGTLVLTGSDDKTARVWKARTGEQVLGPMRFDHPVVHVAFSPDGRHVLAAAGKRFERTVHNTTQLPPRVQQVPIGVGPGGVPRYATTVVPGGSIPNRQTPEGSAQVWDVARRQVVNQIVTDGWLNHASFSPDGTRVVVAGGNEEGDSEVQVWRVGTESERSTRLQTQLGGLIGNAALGRPLGMLAWLHPSWNRLEESGEPVESSLHVQEAWFSPDGRLILTARGGVDTQQGEALLLDARTKRPVGKPLRHGRAVTHARFSPDGRRIVTASRDGTARVWDTATSQPLTPPLAHGDALAGVWFSPTGGRILTACADGSARVYDSASGKALGPPLRHANSLTSAAFSKDGRHVLTADRDGLVLLWDLISEHHGNPWLNHHTVLPRFEPVTYTTRLSDPDDEEESLSRSRSYLGDLIVTAAFFSPDGGRIFTGAGGRLTEVVPGGGKTQATTEYATHRLCGWDAAKGRPAWTPLPADAALTPASFSPDGGSAVTLKQGRFGGAGGDVCLWDLKTGKSLAEHRPAPGTLALAAAFDAAGRCLFAAAGPKKVEVRHLAGKDSATLLASVEHNEPLELAAFSPDGGRLVTVGTVTTRQKKRPMTFESVIRVWDVKSGKPHGKPLRFGGLVTRLAVSPDGDRLVSYGAKRSRLPATNYSLPDGDQAAEAQLWDVAAGTSVALRHGGTVLHAGFDPKGGQLITASADRSARVWEAATGRPLTPPLEHRGAVNHAAFGPSGLVVTSSSDHTARLWDVSTGEMVGPPLAHRDEVLHASFRADGRQLVTASCDGTARVWTLTLDGWGRDDLLRFAQLLAGRRLDESGGLMILDPAAKRDLLKQLHSSQPRFFSSSEPVRLAWHRGRADEAEQAEDWFAAAAHLAPLAEAEDGWLLRVRRGRALARQARWPQAAVEYEKGVKLEATAPAVWQALALAQLAGGDRTGSRRTAADMIRRFGKSENADLARMVVRTAVLADARDERERAAELAKRVAAGKDGKQAPTQAVLGAALYRAGESKAAVAPLALAVKQSSAEESAWAGLFLAMAHHRLGDHGEARKCLARAVQQMTQKRETPLLWLRQVELQVLRQEAETLLGAKDS